MPENPASATELTSQYSAQVAGDLDRNTKEQERIGAEIEALQAQLGTLQHDHNVLVSMQQALGVSSPALPDTTAAQSAPEQASAAPKPTKAKKAGARDAKKTAAKKSTAKASPAATSAPTLVELIRAHLVKQGEPRSAAEISSALGQAHPERNVKTTVVRTTLEGLVAKSHAHRAKQGSSVFYTAAAAPEPIAAEPQPEAPVS
ncbi:hypothetical protein [Streptomyces sp. NBC_00696]|uniref:hypothetical protein n=1 Tax=Streptomyces sp. NBC_00696 TaxID=2903672 RepID=UPI002E301F34|nr:hypothetical protein [Streptomyces sp. NBC_00696]